MRGSAVYGVGEFRCIQGDNIWDRGFQGRDLRGSKGSAV